MVKNNSDLIIEALKERGINTFFIVTGGAIAPLVDALSRHHDVKYYCYQHEQSAGMAAEAYYRVSKKMCAVFATSGPGAQNLLNSVCGCWYESIPSIFITGQVNTNESLSSVSTVPRQVGFQEMPTVSVFSSFTKTSYLLKKEDNPYDIILNAIDSALTGRYGPVHIDIPVNIQVATNGFKTDIGKKTDNISIEDENINAVIRAITNAERPLVLVGHGVRLAGAEDDVIDFLNKTQLNSVSSWGGTDILSGKTKKYIGNIGVYGDRGANFAVQSADLLLILGSRLDTRQTGGNLNLFSRESYKIAVDIDVNELKKDRGILIDLPIHGDVKHFLSKINTSVQAAERSSWDIQCVSYANSQYDTGTRKGTEKLSSYDFLHELHNKLDENAIIIPDEGGNLVWTMQTIKPKSKQRLFSNFGNSSMGYALPASIGASIANPSRQIVCIDGDGGFQMNIQELQTVYQYRLPIKIFILNNNCYGIIKQFQDAYFGGRYIATDKPDYTAPDFASIAKAYKIKSYTLTATNFKEQLNEILNAKEPVLVDVIIDENQKLIPKLNFGGSLEDMHPYLSEYEVRKNMLINPSFSNKEQGWKTIKQNEED